MRKNKWKCFFGDGQVWPVDYEIAKNRTQCVYASKIEAEEFLNTLDPSLNGYIEYINPENPIY